MKYIVEPLEILIVVLLLLTIQGVFWPPLSYLERPVVFGDSSDSFGVLAHTLLALFLAISCIARPVQMLAALRNGWLLFLLIGLAYLSAFWSDVPDLVLRRSTTLMTTTLFGVYLVTRFGLEKLIALLVRLNGVAVVASFAVFLLAPGLVLSGIVDYPTAWRGAYTAKNTLGSASALGVMLAFYALWHGYGSRIIAIVLIPANLLLLHLSQSSTSLVFVFVAACVAAVAVAFRQRSGGGFITGYVLLVIGLLGGGLVALGWDEVLAMLGRNPTLTSRSEIWAVVKDYIARRPWLGYGYGAFWRKGGLEAREVWGVLRFTVPHAHNVWLEIGLELGIVGMISITLVWLAAFYRGLRALTVAGTRHVPFCLALFAATLAENITEFEFFRPDSLPWLMFTIAFIHLGREIAAYSPQRAIATSTHELAPLEKSARSWARRELDARPGSTDAAPAN